MNIVRGKETSKRIANLRNLVENIQKDINVHKHDKNKIIFYGGEPLLNQLDMLEFMKIMGQNDNLTYRLYTNGVLLHQIEQDLLERLSVMYISVDGTESAHKKLRGVGTYKRIIENVKKVRPFFQGHIIANMTLVPNFSLFDGIVNLVDLGLFDSIHWNIVNDFPPYKFAFDDFLPKYKEDVEKLAEYWIEKMKRGSMINLIPFQAVAIFLINGDFHRNLLCGCGTDLRL